MNDQRAVGTTAHVQFNAVETSAQRSLKAGEGIFTVSSRTSAVAKQQRTRHAGIVPARASERETALPGIGRESVRWHYSQRIVKRRASSRLRGGRSSSETTLSRCQAERQGRPKTILNSA